MAIPRDPVFDGSIGFLTQGYLWIGNRCRALGTDAFRTRLALRPVVVMKGKEAASRFYDGRSFTREGAMPPTTLRLLQDKGSVQSLDGEAHRHRKKMFLRITGPGDARHIADLFEDLWQDRLGSLRGQEIVLHDQVVQLLASAACAWAGVREPPQLGADLAAMIEGAGGAGPTTWAALARRQRAERWARAEIAAARQGRRDGPVAALACHRDIDGKLISDGEGGVELLNLVRPIVAVGRFIAFAAAALHHHPGWRTRLRREPDLLLPFAQEVRRFYPFFPAIAGRVSQPFRWHGHRFEHNDWVLLGLHATNHDPQLWPSPGQFRPERFVARRPGLNDMVPQGAGDPARDHRCPGEDFTLALIIRAVELLVEMPYETPDQDLGIPLNSFPTLPRSGVRIRLPH